MLLVAMNLQPLGGGMLQAEVPLLEGVSQQTSSLYNPLDRRDPFQSLLGSAELMKVPKVESDTLEVTQSTWKVLGIISGSNGIQAVIQNARGQRYLVLPGDIIGAERMRVRRLTSSSVTLETFSAQSIQGQHSAPHIIELNFQ